VCAADPCQNFQLALLFHIARFFLSFAQRAQELPKLFVLFKWEPIKRGLPLGRRLIGGAVKETQETCENSGCLASYFFACCVAEFYWLWWTDFRPTGGS
jgi:hypothetical protein